MLYDSLITWRSESRVRQSASTPTDRKARGRLRVLFHALGPGFENRILKSMLIFGVDGLGSTFAFTFSFVWTWRPRITIPRSVPMITQKSDTISSQFLDLPPELRNLIYIEFFASGDAVTIHTPGARKHLEEPALLWTNHQIRDEAVDLFYLHTTFICGALYLDPGRPPPPPAFQAPATPSTHQSPTLPAPTPTPRVEWRRGKDAALLITEKCTSFFMHIPRKRLSLIRTFQLPWADLDTIFMSKPLEFALDSRNLKVVAHSFEPMLQAVADFGVPVESVQCPLIKEGTWESRGGQDNLPDWQRDVSKRNLQVLNEMVQETVEQVKKRNKDEEKKRLAIAEAKNLAAQKAERDMEGKRLEILEPKRVETKSLEARNVHAKRVLNSLLAQSEAEEHYWSVQYPRRRSRWD